jgi:L-iditol 2-dehydrogenase
MMKRAGAAKVITSDLSEARLAQSRRMGADVAVKASGRNVYEAVMDETGGAGAHYVIEAVGARESFLESVQLARNGANMLFFGLPDTAEPISIDFNAFFRKRITANATYGAQFEPGLVSFRQALDLIVRGEIDMSPLVSHMLSIEQIDEAMHMAHDRSDNALKVSLTF